MTDAAKEEAFNEAIKRQVDKLRKSLMTPGGQALLGNLSNDGDDYARFLARKEMARMANS